MPKATNNSQWELMVGDLRGMVDMVEIYEAANFSKVRSTEVLPQGAQQLHIKVVPFNGDGKTLLHLLWFASHYKDVDRNRKGEEWWKENNPALFRITGNKVSGFSERLEIESLTEWRYGDNCFTLKMRAYRKEVQGALPDETTDSQATETL